MSRVVVAPIIMIVLSLMSATLYGVEGNWRLTIYWVAAAVLTASVTF